MRIRMVLIGCLCLGLAGSLSAERITWTGAVDTNWFNPDNWSPSKLPKAGIDRAQINLGPVIEIGAPGAGAHDMVIQGAETVTLTVLPEGELTVTKFLMLGFNPGAGDHVMEVLGVVNMEARPSIGWRGKGKLVIDDAGVMNVNNQYMELGGGGNSAEIVGLVELRGGFLNLGELPLYIGRGENPTCNIDFSGGVMTRQSGSLVPDNVKSLEQMDDYIANGLITAYGGEGTVVVTEDATGLVTIKGIHPFNPSPEDGSFSVSPGTVTLAWTVPDGMPVDVWFDTDSSLDPERAQRLVSKETVSRVDVRVDPKTRYYWAVDTYDEGINNDPNLGRIFSFYVDNQAPVVTGGDDIVTWLVDGTGDVAISALVQDADPTTVQWTVVSEPDDPNRLDAMIADSSQLETTVTLSAIGAYILQLEADDGEYTGSDMLTINVYSDHCEAAQSLPGFEPLPGDVNFDCIVDGLDLAIVQDNWLRCNGLDCPEVN